MAKKARTPAPPKRPVQAPQKRTTKRPRGGTAGASNRGGRLVAMIAVLVVVAAAAIAAALYFALRKSGSSASTTTKSGFEMHVDPAQDATYNHLPGVRKTKAPWAPEFAQLDNRLAPLGLKALSSEALVYHIHQHLDVYLNGKPIVVPECIGILGCYKHFVYLTELHTHNTDGVIHNESETKRNYTLGQFFSEWGVLLNKQCVGADCQGYKWYVNGKRMTGNPQDLVLKAHLVIVIAIGKQPKHIRSTYAWNGL